MMDQETNTAGRSGSAVGAVGHIKDAQASLQRKIEALLDRQASGHLGSRLPMKINRATDYAVRAVVQLAASPVGQKVPLNVLAEAAGVRQSFLSKILQQLVRQGLVTSCAGTGGGFSLNLDAKQVTLLQVIEAMEGPTQLNLCLKADRSCERKPSCPVHPVWRRAQAALTEVLGGVTMAELAEESATGPSTNDDFVGPEG